MKTILSIQSHVAFGHVGNAAAVFPLQRMGFEVIAINTVQFSNHTGYGDWGGEVYGAAQVKDVLSGLERRGVMDKVDGLLTGYLGDPAIGEVVLETAAKLPNAAWLCDPVMGDTGRGFFVASGIPGFFKDRAVPDARIVTPNQFELEYLSSREIRTLEDARAGCTALHDLGPEIVLVTSLMTDRTGEREISMLASHKDGEAYLVTTPRLDLNPAPNGAGDCTAALFLGHILAGEPLDRALGLTAASVFKLFEATKAAGTRELALIAAQEVFVSGEIFDVIKI